MSIGLLCYTECIIWHGRILDMGDWDDSLKVFINDNAQDFATWILKGAQFTRKLLTEFKIRTIEADSLLEVMLDGLDVTGWTGRVVV